MSESEHADRDYYQNIILLTVNLPLCVIAGSLNVLLICCSALFFKRYGAAPHGFICSMTAADALLTALAGPYLAYLKSLKAYSQTRSVCSTFLRIINAARRASLLSLALIKIDKVFYIFCHKHYASWFRMRSCVIMSLVVWLASILSATGIHQFGWVQLVPINQQTWPNQSNINFCSEYKEIVDIQWFFIDALIFFVLPSIIAVVATSCLFIRSNHDHDLEAGVSAYTSLCTTLWFLLTLMPVKVYYGLKWANVAEDDWTEFAFICLESFNAVVNPMIAITVQEKYLSEVRGISLFFWRV